MPESLAPGVYVEEAAGEPRPIEGVSTSTAAFLGETERGTIVPTLVTSYLEFARRFGVGVGFMSTAVDGFFTNGGSRLYACRIARRDAASASTAFDACTLSALGPGAWGNRIRGVVSDCTGATSADFRNGFRLRLAYWEVHPPGFVPFDPFDPAHATTLPRPSILEDHDDLSPDPASPNYHATRLEAQSALARMTGPAGSRPVDGASMLLGGADGATPADADDFAGEPAARRAERQGLATLADDAYRDVSLVYAPYPSRDADAIAKLVVAHCEAQRFRFAIVDCAPGLAAPETVDPRAAIADSSFAAIYHPWLRVAHPDTEAPTLVPPGGHVLGVYAFTDVERGVHKAPANVLVRGAVGLEFDIDAAQQVRLESRGRNAIRTYSGRGIRVWGARTLSSDPEWKYVPVRRLFIYLERSIDEGTQWTVFEPNEEPLWKRFAGAIREFLGRQWRAGLLAGRIEDEAFFVTCDRTTMSQDDIDHGRLVCEIGVAPIGPAKFVVLRLFRSTRTEAAAPTSTARGG